MQKSDEHLFNNQNTSKNEIDENIHRISNDEKSALLSIDDNNVGLSKNKLIFGFIFFFIILINCIPKIYISNEIYYLSRDISKLQNQFMLLNDEKRKLLRALDDFKLKQLLNDAQIQN